MLEISGNQGLEAPPAGNIMEPRHIDPSPDQPGGATPSSYLWEPVGTGVSVYLDFDVVDRLGYDVMRGFGAVPRRGAEVGGILLGTAETGERLVIHIEDYALVQSEHLHGPSFILSEKDLELFDETLARWTPSPERRISAVGYFRSNTREGCQLAAEDLTILDSRFAIDGAICLLIKPYATQVPEATYFFRQAGQFVTACAGSEFPFRRRELGGGKPPRRTHGEAEETAEAAEESGAAPAPPEIPQLIVPAPAEAAQPRPETPSKARAGWFWIPLSFVFLLLGVALGFQVALSLSNHKPAEPAADPYSLDLTVVQFGANLHLNWNPDAAAIKGASSGQLEIEDGNSTKIIELSRDDLARGSVLYRQASGTVRFRLEVRRGERGGVVERQEVKVAGAPDPPSEVKRPAEPPSPPAREEKRSSPRSRGQQRTGVKPR
jgi:hypothetical protein